MSKCRVLTLTNSYPATICQFSHVLILFNCTLQRWTRGSCGVLPHWVHAKALHRTSKIRIFLNICNTLFTVLQIQYCTPLMMREIFGCLTMFTRVDAKFDLCLVPARRHRVGLSRLLLAQNSKTLKLWSRKSKRMKRHYHTEGIIIY